MVAGFQPAEGAALQALTILFHVPGPSLRSCPGCHIAGFQPAPAGWYARQCRAEKTGQRRLSGHGGRYARQCAGAGTGPLRALNPRRTVRASMRRRWVGPLRALNPRKTLRASMRRRWNGGYDRAWGCESGARVNQTPLRGGAESPGCYSPGISELRERRPGKTNYNERQAL